MFGNNTASNNLMHKPTNVQNRFIDTLVSLGYVQRKDVAGLEERTEAEIAKSLMAKSLFNGTCSLEQIARAYSAYYGLPFVKLSDKVIDKNVLWLISKNDARQYKIIAFSLENNNLQLALGDPTVLQAQAPVVLSNLAQKGYGISLSIAAVDDIERIVNSYDQQKPLLPNTNAVSANTTVPQQAFQNNTSTDSGVSYIDLKTIEIPVQVLMKFPREVADKYKMVVFETEPPMNVSTVSKKIKVALLDPNDAQAKEILEFIKKRNNLEVIKFKCDQDGLTKALAGYGPAIGSAISSSSMPNSSGPQKIIEKTAQPEEKIISKDEKEKAKETDKSEQSPSDEKKGPKEDEKKDDIGEKVKTIDESQVKSPNVSPERKNNQMQAIASSVLKPEEDRLKEGMANPYGITTPVDKPEIEKAEVIPEIKLEDIDQSAGLTAESSMDENLEDNNLDRFLSHPVNVIGDLESVIKAGMIPEIVAGIVSLAIVLEASDIHIEAASENVRLRFRIDGILKDVIKMPMSLHAPLVSRIKILSKLKIDEQRVPQDGRFDVIVRKHEIDLRVSTLPTVHGEKVVLRILDKSVGILTLEDMGITGVAFDVLVKNIKKPYGIILATGPTGSGKSTTLYAILQRISTPIVNVITLEDPVEYEISGINQVQVKPQIGFSFAEGLRSVLRQDPNIIMVGEIRDLETAAMSTHAALTGHLVLSTLHTNDSAGALPRLINMGVEPFLITSSVNCIIAQRLVRKICSKCKEKVDLPPALIDELMDVLSKIKDTKISNIKKEMLTFYHGKGCSDCTNGYHGRIGIYEVLEMNDEIEALAVDKQPSSAIVEQATKDGMITMKQDGILKAMKGITTIDEVLRVTSSD